MPLYTKIDGKFKKVKSAGLAKEKSLQILVEENLEEMLGMYFLESEYSTTHGGRIDTLAVDFSGAPVIIEYKLNKNINVINQGLSYLRWLKAQKVDFFEMLVQKRLGKEVAEKLLIDWKNPRVVCIAEAYSKFDTDTVEVVPLRIELFKYISYENDLFYLERLNVQENKAPSDTGIVSSTKTESTVTDEASLKTLIANASPKIASIFQDLRELITAIDESIVEKVTQGYVAYKMAYNFAEVVIGKNQLKIHMRPIDYNDPKMMVEKVPDGYNWTLNRRVYVKNEDDLNYVVDLIEQAYKDVL